MHKNQNDEYNALLACARSAIISGTSGLSMRQWVDLLNSYRLHKDIYETAEFIDAEATVVSYWYYILSSAVAKKAMTVYTGNS